MGTGISFQKKERVLPPATITRFSRPVAQEELNSIVPERQVERRRSLSLANATKSNGSRADYEEWVALAQAESLARTPTSSILGRTPTIKQPNDAQSLSSVNIVQASPNNLATVKNLHQQLPPFDSSNSVSTSEDNSFVWEAVLFGTDTDFLERAHVRMIFKNNALLPEDVVFFQLPEVPLPPTDAEIAEAAPHAASANNAATENNRDASGRREECVLL